MAMAKAEGWTKNPKYKTMGAYMLRLRSSVLLIRTTCPEVLLGMQTADEVEDVRIENSFLEHGSERWGGFVIRISRRCK